MENPKFGNYHTHIHARTQKHTFTCTHRLMVPILGILFCVVTKLARGCVCWAARTSPRVARGRKGVSVCRDVCGIDTESESVRVESRLWTEACPNGIPVPERARAHIFARPWRHRASDPVGVWSKLRDMRVIERECPAACCSCSRAQPYLWRLQCVAVCFARWQCVRKRMTMRPQVARLELLRCWRIYRHSRSGASCRQAGLWDDLIVVRILPTRTHTHTHVLPLAGMDMLRFLNRPTARVQHRTAYALENRFPLLHVCCNGAVCMQERRR